MGNTVCLPTDNNEDKGTEKVKAAAVGQHTDTIDEAIFTGINSLDQLKQRIILTFECANLPNMDKNSKTDGFLVLF